MLDVTVLLVGIALLVCHKHIDGAVFRNLHIHILCDVCPASILCDFRLYAFYGKVPVLLPVFPVVPITVPLVML